MGVWAWSFVGFVVARHFHHDRAGLCQRNPPPNDVRGRLGRVLQTVGQSARTPQVQAVARRGGDRARAPLLMAGVLVGTVRGVTEQTDDISAVGRRRNQRGDGDTDALGIEEGELEAARQAVEDAAPAITTGVLVWISVRHRGAGRDRRRHHPRRAHHVLHAQGRHPTPPRRRLRGRSGIPERVRRLHRTLVSCPTRLWARPFRHVGDRFLGRRRRGPPDGLAARLHHRGGELHRRLHPLHRRVPRRRARGDHRPRRGWAPQRRAHARHRARREPRARRTSWNPRSWAARSTSTRSWCSS